MSHILITNRLGKTTRFHLGVGLWVVMFVIFGGIFGGMFYLGQQFGTQEAEPNMMLTQMKKELDQYKGELKVVRVSLDENMNALAQRLGNEAQRVVRHDQQRDARGLEAPPPVGQRHRMTFHEHVGLA